MTAMAIMIPTWLNGKLQPFEKLAAHQQGLRHKAVSVFVIAGSQILIQQRALGKYHTPGLWANACCTHPEWTEDADVCAVRRLDEELSITGVIPLYCGQVEYHADVGNGMTEHEVVEVFVVQADLNMNIRPNPDEVMATRWVEHDQLITEVANERDRFTPWLRIYMEEHFDMILSGINPRQGSQEA